MKELFIITYLIITNNYVPCSGPASAFIAPYLCVEKDTSTVEVITTDTARVNTLLRAYPAAKVDTFLLTTPK